jgi:hypothetical protein
LLIFKTITVDANRQNENLPFYKYDFQHLRIEKGVINNYLLVQARISANPIGSAMETQNYSFSHAINTSHQRLYYPSSFEKNSFEAFGYRLVFFPTIALTDDAPDKRYYKEE